MIWLAFIRQRWRWLMVPLAIVVLIVVYYAGRCSRPEPFGDLGIDDSKVTIPLTPDEVEEHLPDPDRNIVERLTEVRIVPAARGGLTNDETLAAVEAYVDAALAKAAADRDTTGEMTAPSPVFPLVRVETDDKRLRALGVLRSDGAYIVERADCEHPCEAGTRDSVMYFDHKRQLPSFDIGKTLLTCGAVAGAAAGIAYAADYDKPGLAAGVAGGSCGFLALAF